MTISPAELLLEMEENLDSALDRIVRLEDELADVRALEVEVLEWRRMASSALTHEGVPRPLRVALHRILRDRK